MVMFMNNILDISIMNCLQCLRLQKALGDTGCISVCESGTEPVACVMVEAPDKDTCQKYVDEVVNVICENGYKA